MENNNIVTAKTSTGFTEIQYANSQDFVNSENLCAHAVLEYYLQFFDADSLKLYSQMTDSKKTDFEQKVKKNYNINSRDVKILQFISKYEHEQAKIVFLEGVNENIKIALEQHASTKNEAKETFKQNQKFINQLTEKNDARWSNIEKYPEEQKFSFLDAVYASSGIQGNKLSQQVDGFNMKKQSHTTVNQDFEAFAKNEKSSTNFSENMDIEKQINDDYIFAWKLQAEEYKKNSSNTGDIQLKGLAKKSPSYKFKATQGQAIEFSLQETSGDGDCFFHAVGREDILTRESLVNRLLENSSQENIRKGFAHEIRQFLYLGYTDIEEEITSAEDLACRELLKKEIIELFKRLQVAESVFRDEITLVRETQAEEGTTGKTPKQLLTLLQQQQHGLYEQFNTAYEKVVSLNDAIYQYCFQESVFKDYVNLYIKGAKGYIPFHRDFGQEAHATTIDTINELFGLNIQIYMPQNNDTNELTLANQIQTEEKIINIIHNGRSHFSGLKAIQPSNNTDDAQNKLSQQQTKVNVSHEVAKPYYNEKFSILKGTGDYEASGLKKSLHGNVYQLKLLMLFLKRGIENSYNFQLATEMDDADKFDDVVFKCSTTKENQKSIYRFLQAKHRYEDGSKIADSDLLTEKDKDFSLQKYFMSYLKIKKTFTDGELADFTICTNINFDFAGDNATINLKDALEKIEKIDDVLNISGAKKAERYRFKDIFKGKEALYTALKSSHLVRLIEKIAEAILSNANLDLRTPIIKQYRVALLNEGIIDQESKKISSNFIKGINISESAKKFRARLFEKIAHEKKLGTELLKYDDKIQEIIKTSECGVSKSFNKSSENSEEDFEILPNAETITDKEIDEFLKLLIFAVNQPNEKELGNIIGDEIGENFNLDGFNFIVSEFQVQMLDWMKNKQGTFLSEHDGKAFFEQAKNIINKLILVGPTLEYRAVLERNKIDFKRSVVNLQDFLNSKNKILNCVTEQDTYLTSINVYKSLSKCGQFKSDDSYIFLQIDTCINLQDRLKSAFMNKKSHLLVIECNKQISQEEGKALVDIFNEVLVQKNSAKKIILISTKKNEFASLFCKRNTLNEQQNVEIKYDDFCENTLNNFIEKKVLLCNKSMPLREFVSENYLNEVLYGKALLEFLNSEKIIIYPTFGLSEIESNCYIDRNLFKKRQINLECFKKNNLDIFAISGIDKENFKSITGANVIRNFVEEDNDKGGPSKYIILDSNEQASREQFGQLAKKFTKENIHWLKIENGKFIWQKSYGSIAGLREYLEGDESDYSLDKIQDKTVIISAIPGMGKSSVIDYWATQILKTRNIVWPIKIDLKTKKELIEEEKFDSIKSALKFLSAANGMSMLLRSFMQHFLEKTSDKLFLFLDGFDEISSKQQVKIIALMRVLREECKDLNMVIATRQHMQEDLENALGVFSYNLQSFSIKDREIYLRKFWEGVLGLLIQTPEQLKRFNCYVEALIKIFGDATKDINLDFMGIPLQSWLLAEAFKKDFEAYYNNNAKIIIPKSLDLVDLYNKFKEELYDIYLTEKEDSKDIRPIHKDLIFAALTEGHRRIAFDFLFKNESNDFFIYEMYPRFTESELKRVGIIHGQNKVNFVHRTFAEYFVADLFAARLREAADSILFKKTKEFLLLHIFKARNKVIFQFLDNVVKKIDENSLSNAWKSICDSMLDINTLQKNKIYVTEYANRDDPKELIISAETLKNNLSPYVEKTKTGNKVQKDDILSFFPDFYDKLLKIKDLPFLEEMLESLCYIAKEHPFNLLKIKILERADELIEHYLAQCFVQNHLEIEFKLLDDFASISSYNSQAARDSSILRDVAGNTKKINRQLQIYKDLINLIKEKNFKWGNALSEADILYLKISNLNFNRDQFNTLEKFRQKWWGQTWVGSIFKQLYLQVDASEANEVKNIYINSKEYSLLKELIIKFPALTLTEKEIVKHYSHRDLGWLERDGVYICLALNVLNNKAVEYFKRIIINNYKINGWHLKYAENIFNGLILPLIDQQQSVFNAKFDKFSFLILFVSFVEFAIKQDICFCLNANQLEFVLKKIEEIFNDELITSEMLSINIKNMLWICDSLKLKVVNVENGVLILEPINDFVYILPLNKLIIELIRKFNQEKSEKELVKGCNKFITRAFGLEETFTPRFNMNINEQENDGAIQRPTKIRKLKRVNSELINRDNVYNKPIPIDASVLLSGHEGNRAVDFNVNNSAMSVATINFPGVVQIAENATSLLQSNDAHTGAAININQTGGPSISGSGIHYSFSRGCENLTRVAQRAATSVTGPLVYAYKNSNKIKHSLYALANAASREGVLNGLQRLARPRCSFDGASRL